MAEDQKALSTEVNLSDAAQALREKIRTAFVELITPEQWAKMVEVELESFVNERQVPLHSGTRETRRAPSVFHEVCEQVYREHVKALIQAALTEPEWKASWNGRPIVSAAVKEWLTENSDKLLQTVLMEMFSSAAQQFVNNVHQR